MDTSLSDGQIREALEFSHDGFMIADSDGTIIYRNPAYIALTNLGELSQPGTSLQKLVDQGEIDGSSCLRAIEEHVCAADIHPTKGNSIISVSNPVYDDQGNIRFVVVNVQDITDYLKLHDKIQQTNERLAKISRDIGEKALYASGVIAVSEEMCQCLEQARRISSYDVPVLIQGESGSGKDVIAHYIHNNSGRSSHNFISVNCGAIPEQLLETELFGYAEGTFTGQVRGGKKGLLAAAEGGTLFLDEIGDMPLALQTKLLHVLETGWYRPVGSTQQLSTNVRFLYATNRDLKAMVRDRTFREDLYYRINVISLYVHPLRERRDDIYPLCLYFLDHYNKKYNLKKQISHSVIDQLAKYDWPGNVRELKNTIEMMVVLSADTYLELPARFGLGEIRVLEHDHPGIRQPHSLKSGETACETHADPHAKQNTPAAEDIQPTEDTDGEISTLDDFLGRQEKAYLLSVYHQVGTTRRMAEVLGVNHSTIMRKLKRYDIHLK